ncbi:hypothetical protein [Paramesorhizobium deserti]|uniref:hypothetical protein n=1 Tax=Paramesorhizobium deserti TaxID=1494590 RepID=UPI000A4873F7
MLTATDLADCLARDAEAVCRHYLSAGRRAGNYWVVGDVANNEGRSLYVHLVRAMPRLSVGIIFPPAAEPVITGSLATSPTMKAAHSMCI